MKLFKYFFVISLFILVALPAVAQSNLSMQATNLPQNMALNPAIAPSRAYMSVPFVGDFNIGARTAVSVNDILTIENGVKYLDYSKMYKNLSGANDINVVDLNLNFLSGGFYVSKNDFIGINISTRLHIATNIPEGAVGFLLDNPINLANQTFNASASPNIIGWNEFGVSYSRKINDNFRLGIRLKYLMGIASVQGSGASFTLDKTFEGYNIKGDLDIKAGNVDFANPSNIISGIFDNPGVAGDIGIEYISSDRHFVAMASVSDIGAIFWNDKYSSQIKARNPNQSFQFNGFGELQGLFNGNVNFPELMDSVFNKFSQTIGVDTIRNEKFTTFIPTRYHVMAEYAIDRDYRHNVSLAFFGTSAYNRGFDYSISAGYTYRPKTGRWQLMANYTYRPNIPIAVGIGGAYTSRGFQIYLGLDNVLPLFDLKNAKSFGAQLSMNIRF